MPETANKKNLLGDELRSPSEGFVDGLARVVTERVLAELRLRPERRLLSKRALAEHYGVTPRTVKTWREKGCPALRVGRLMFDIDEVGKWLDREGSVR
jgi:hypothetical protein